MSVTTFISYSHDSTEHKEFVLNLAQRMRNDGVTTMIDAFEPFPEQGWQNWMRTQIAESNYVIMLFTPQYAERFLGQSKKTGKGVTFEGSIITQNLYDNFGRNGKFIPAVLDNSNIKIIPDEIRQYTIYLLMNNYDDLLRFITKQPKIIPNKIGNIKKLKPSSKAQQELNGIISNIQEFIEKPIHTLSLSKTNRILKSIDHTTISNKENLNLANTIKTIIIFECYANDSAKIKTAKEIIKKLTPLNKTAANTIRRIKAASPVAKSIIRKGCVNAR